MNGFESASTETLKIIHGNLLKGLDIIADSIEHGTFHTTRAKGGSPPSQSGHTSVWFLLAVNTELVKRGEPCTLSDLLPLVTSLVSPPDDSQKS